MVGRKEEDLVKQRHSRFDECSVGAGAARGVERRAAKDGWEVIVFRELSGN